MNHDSLCTNIQELVAVMKKLRAPDGCPWDRKQTHESLMPYIMEECAEFLDAVAEKDNDNMREELGDILMHIVLHSVMAEERGEFTFTDVVRDITGKMKHRHPHVFSDEKVQDAEEVVGLWERVKAQEKEHAPEKRVSLLDGVPMHCPALIQAEKLQKKAAKVGFDWTKQEEIIDKIQEELDELKAAVKSGNGDCIDEELGDLLFATANLSRFRKGRSGELLLAAANRKFKKRFMFMEKELAVQGKKFEDCNIHQLEQFWQNAKKHEGSNPSQTADNFLHSDADKKSKNGFSTEKSK